MEQSISQKILNRIYGYGKGSVFTPADFADLSDSQLVRQTMSRLVKKGILRRLIQGVYEYPRYSELLGAPAPPDPHAMAKAIARARGWTIFPSGETALNLLDLSTQVPAAWEYLSDGPSKTYRWDGGILSFRRRANRETTILSPESALVVQALKALGEEHVDAAVLARIAARLTAKEKARLLKEAKFATAWVYKAIRRMCNQTGGPDARDGEASRPR